MAGKRTILVTGCSDGGLGSYLALALHSQGWRVIASARTPSKMAAAKKAGIECVQLDVSSEASIAAAVEAVKQLTGGSLDGLINNAGGGYSMPIIHVDVETARKMFDINVFSIITITQAFLPLLLKSDQKPIIANNTSGAGLFNCGSPFQGSYAASKAAAVSLTESMRLELAPFGIRVVNLVTGGVESGFFDNSNDAKLPEDSIYNLAREAIEPPMNGIDEMNRTPATTWAKQVAKDLSQRKPPHMIYRGVMAGTAKFVSILPVASLDGIHKKNSGINVLEQKIKENGGFRVSK